MKYASRTIQEENSAETLEDRYEIYLSFADNGHGMDITTNSQKPLKTFEEWLGS